MFTKFVLCTRTRTRGPASSMKIGDTVNSTFTHRGKLRRWLSAIALTASAALLAACATAAPAEDDGASGEEQTVRVGIVGFSAADATANKTAELMVEQAEALGWETEYQAANPAGDSSSANSLMQVMLQKGATLLITMNFDPDTLGAGLAAAREAGVPVMGMSSGKLGDGMAWASNVGYIPEYGELIRSDLDPDAERIEVLNLQFLLATPGQGRDQLMQEIAADDPRINLTDREVPIPGAVQGGRDFTTAWLAANPPTPGVQLIIYAVFDQPAEGAVAALRQAGRDDVLIYSYDATPVGLELVKEGFIRGNIQNGRQAQADQVIAAAQQVVSGEITVDDPVLVPVAFFIVTTDNVEQYEIDFPAAFTEEGV